MPRWILPPAALLLTFLAAPELPRAQPAAQPAGGTVTLADAFPALSSFALTTDIQAPDDGSNRLFAVEQVGRIYAFDNDPDADSAALFLDLSDRVAFPGETGEAGLLGLAFDPDFATNGYLYVHYDARDPLRAVVSRFTVSDDDPNRADPASEAVVFVADKENTAHNGGQIQFGPAEGPGGERYLYVALGDDYRSGNGQNASDLGGELLRLDVDGGGLPLDCAAGPGLGTVPPDNPGTLSEVACDEMYAYGFRNPWRFSFDPQGRLWLADVGQFEWEEIDLVEAGGNYGWSRYEGSSCFNPPCDPEGKAFPIYEYPHRFGEEGGFAVIGGYVYDGPNCAELRGRYVYGDYVTANLWALEYDGTTATNALLIPRAPRPTTFGLDEQGNLFFTGAQNRIVRFVCAQAVAVAVSPVDPPVVVGGDGGVVAFDVALTNTTGEAQAVEAWATADLADGSEAKGLVPPVPVTLPPGGTTTLRMQAELAAEAPEGRSTFVVKVGGFPDAPISEDHFTVTKLPRVVPTDDAPEAAEVLGASPNPFVGRTTIEFALPTPTAVRVEVLDLLGRAVAVLADRPAEAGWHEVVWEAGGAPVGVYVVRMLAGERAWVRRVTLLR